MIILSAIVHMLDRKNILARLNIFTILYSPIQLPNFPVELLLDSLSLYRDY